MKLSKVILILSVLLLCGILLHAASNNRAIIKSKESKGKTTKVQVERDLDFVPGTVLL